MDSMHPTNGRGALDARTDDSRAGVRGLVSVMMPVFNAAPYIAQAIESLLAQRYRHWELIVIDDGSTDGSGDVARAYGDTRIRVFSFPNRGEAASRNRALDRMDGEFVAFLDADDEYQPNHLEATVQHLNGHPEHDAVFTDGAYVTADGRRIQTLSSRRVAVAPGRIFDEIAHRCDVLGPPLCVLLRRDVVLRHNLRYDEGLTIGPDWDFFIRFADLGTFGYVDAETCLYRLHGANISTTIAQPTRARDGIAVLEKVIKMASFARCSVVTRYALLHKLLVVGLRGQLERQRSVLQWPEFETLPAAERSRLLRLMASQAILGGGRSGEVLEWLASSRRLDPHDAKAKALFFAYQASPWLCRAGLRARRAGQRERSGLGPFADMQWEGRQGDR